MENTTILSTRECPHCKKTLFYKNKYIRNSARKQKLVCKPCSHILHPRRCSEQRREKMAIWAKNKFANYTGEQWEKMRADGHKYGILQPPLTSEEKLAISGKGNHFYGKTHSDELKKKVGARFRGKKLSLEHRLKISEGSRKNSVNVGDKNAMKRPEVRLKMRKSLMEKLKHQYGGTHPFYNKDACKYFDELNSKNGWNLQHAENGGEHYLKDLGYWPDAYDKNRNIIVEYDERRHYKMSGELRDKDIRRMNEIINHLNCDFYRYNEFNKELVKIN